MADKEYRHKELEIKWQKRWRETNLYAASPKKPNKYYLLVELTYTSGDLHIGHWFAWSAPDAYARFKRMQGHNVLFPVGGFDAFGLPAENAAIKHGVSPKEWTYKNIDTMRKQFTVMGPSFDWEKEVITSDPDYYRWTQWLFLKLYEAGLAYKDKVWSNWCPECKTVLANEHVVDGCCWRHTETKVIQKEVPQWLFRITSYADKLIWPDKPNVDWPEELREGQNNWIGRSEGVEIKFQIQDSRYKIPVFTTRPDTIFGATFLVLAPEHSLVEELSWRSSDRKMFMNQVSTLLSKTERTRKIEATEKNGFFSGSYAINPFNGKEIPIWIADYVLMNVGTGAVMGVPAHDSRDWDFAKAHKLPIVEVIKGGKVDRAPHEGEGKLINSGKYSGMGSQEARGKITKDVIIQHLGKKSVQYHLRDWTVSRQRYWGAPIPIIYCENCGVVPVPEKDLPVILPEGVDFTPTGRPPLAWAEDWVKVKCPKCGGEAKREVETMDTYVDSSWYFLRYPDPKYKKGPLNPKTIKDWFPIKVYFGGPEHILGHTLYARFITKVLHNLGYLPFDEFAQVRRHHGIILGPDGHRMSKSRGNVVSPSEQVEKYGADTVRMYLCFIGPHEKGGTWELEGIEGMYRFLMRVWRLVSQYRDLVLVEEKDSREILAAQHRTVQIVTKYIETFHFNTAIARIMEFTNLLQEKTKGKVRMAKGGIRCAEWDEALQVLCKLLAPFAPHMAEEIWQTVLNQSEVGQKPVKSQFTPDFNSVHLQPWPKFDIDLTKEKEIVIVVQVDGKLRSNLTINYQLSTNQHEIENLAKRDKKVSKWLSGKKVIKTIFVPTKLVNFVTR